MADDEEAEKVREVARTKSGVELYRELLRHYPLAEIEDYYRAGVWRNDKLKVDIVLLDANRREAGAPDPLPIEEVSMPKLPQSSFNFAQIAVPKVPGLAAVSPAAVSSGLAELRATTLFVAKWKLDPVRAKQALAKLTSDSRRQVLVGFTSEHLSGGPEAYEDFEQYIKTAEETAPSQDPGVPKQPGFSKAPGVLPPAISAAAAAEVRLTTLFTAKFKLDPVRTKTLLARVPIHRRTNVIQTFSTMLTGQEATDALEQYINTSAAEHNGHEAGLKRPLSATGAVENGDIKRPHMLGADSKMHAAGTHAKMPSMPVVVPPKMSNA